jgi:hypothetical protein
MTFGAELHWWRRPAFERDLFDYLICLGLATVWFDKRLISEVIRDDGAKRQAIRDEIDGKGRAA